MLKTFSLKVPGLIHSRDFLSANIKLLKGSQETQETRSRLTVAYYVGGYVIHIEHLHNNITG